MIAHATARSKAFQDRKPELTTRLDLARAHLETTPPGYTLAEVELSSVDKICKAADKKLRSAMIGHRSSRSDAADGALSRPDRARQGTSEDPSAAQTLANIKRFRIEALKLLVTVEEGLGREARAQRCRDLLQDLR